LQELRRHCWPKFQRWLALQGVFLRHDAAEEAFQRAWKKLLHLRGSQSLRETQRLFFLAWGQEYIDAGRKGQRQAFIDDQFVGLWRRRPRTPEEETAIALAREAVQAIRHATLRWLCMYLGSRKVRRAAWLRWHGASWVHIAAVCSYKSDKSARRAVTMALRRALKRSAEAMVDARAIQKDAAPYAKQGIWTEKVADQNKFLGIVNLDTIGRRRHDK
jgi:hypothetical protein